MKNLVRIVSFGFVLLISTAKAATATATPNAEAAETEVKQKNSQVFSRESEIELAELLYVPLKDRTPQAPSIPKGLVPKEKNPLERSVLYANEALAGLIDGDLKRAFSHLGHVTVPETRRFVIEKFFMFCPLHKCKESDVQILHRVPITMLLGSFFILGKHECLPLDHFADLLKYVGHYALASHKQSDAPHLEFFVNRYMIEIMACDWIHNWMVENRQFFLNEDELQKAKSAIAQKRCDLQKKRHDMTQRVIQYCKENKIKVSTH